MATSKRIRIRIKTTPCDILRDAGQQHGENIGEKNKIDFSLLEKELERHQVVFTMDANSVTLRGLSQESMAVFSGIYRQRLEHLAEVKQEPPSSDID